MAARRNLGVCCFVLILVLASTALAQDISLLLQNRDLVNREIGCVLQRNPCDVIGKQIKGLLPEALHNGCGRCTPQQAANAKKLMSFMRQNFPNEWRSILQIYGKPRAVF